MKIGLYFGSFNPIHVGHLIIASHIVDNTSLEQIWFVVSPQNPLKKSSTLLNEHHRISMINIAIEDDARLKSSNVEFKLPRPSYTIDTLTHLAEKYPSHDFSVILGSDSFQNIANWKNHKQIINNYNIYIYPRPSFPVKNDLPNIQVIDAPLLDISSTIIRKNIRQGKSVRYLLPDGVWKELIAKNYYGSHLENPTEQ